MSIWAIIMLILEWGPTVIKVVQEIIELIGKLRDKGEQEMALAELKALRPTYLKTKDMRPLEALRDRLRARHAQLAGG